MRSTSRAALRRRAPKPPSAAILAYRGELRRALVAQQAKLLARILASYKPPVDVTDALREYVGRAYEQATRTGVGTFTITVRGDAAADGSSLDAPIAFRPEVLDRVGGRVAKKATAENKRLVGISRVSGNVDAKTLAKWRKTNVDLIKTLQATQKAQLRNVLDEATEGGWHVDRLRTAIEERFEVTKSHADLIARDQTTKLNAALTKERQTSVGIEEYIWSTSQNETVRDSHAELEGTRQRWDDPPIVDGEPAHPGEPISCHCVAVAIVPWLDDDEEAA